MMMNTRFVHLTMLILLMFLGANLFCNTVPTYNKEEVLPRVKEMETIVSAKYSTAVEGYIKGYTVRNRPKAERILGRMLKYFPLFEEYLKEEEMPDDLKYLAVVESALVPKAVSRVGAGGLWQFMPATGESYGLEINRYVDDRSCPHKSTKAAMKHLGKLYKKYNNWELALAAYNSGAGRVNRAIRLSKSRNFWRLQRYLPRETRNYVPAFIAATYVIKHYHLHELNPVFPEMDLQLTESIKVFDYLSFQKISEVTRIPKATIEELNPSYKRGFIPRSSQGYYLTLPKRVMTAMKDYFQMQHPDGSGWEALNTAPIFIRSTSREATKKPYVKSLYTVAQGDHIWDLARIFSCSVHHIRLWNNLGDNHLSPRQELTVFYPSEYKRYRRASEIFMDNLPPPDLQPLTNLQKKAALKHINTLKAPQPIDVDYYLAKDESLYDLADRLKGVTAEDIIAYNNLNKKKSSVVGQKVKIPMHLVEEIEDFPF